jgi:hypothetical protein
VQSNRKDIIFPFVIFLLFLAASIPGTDWGVPALWNPDEVIWRVDSALRGELQFDITEPDFNYPSLPKYVMFGIGKVVYGLGFSGAKFIIAARLFSALLGAAGGALIYYLARAAGLNQLMSALAGLLYVTSGAAAENSRYAHNDLYLQLFTILCVYFALKYQFTKSNGWVFASFFSVGLAASSKYTGGSLLLVPVFVLTCMNWDELRKNWIRSFGILLAGGLLSFGGYALGTPTALTAPVYYFSNVIPALQRYRLYGFNSGSPFGLVGQWDIFYDAVGPFAYYLFIAGFIWSAARLVLWKRGKIQMDGRQAQAVLILIAAVVIFDLPFMISINYITRYFIPFVPFLSVLAAFFIKDVVDAALRREWKFVPPLAATLLIVGLFYSALRLVSITLLFLNDARIPASEYIKSIRGYQNTVEYTLYPPIVDKKQFYGAARNYPIYFVKYAEDIVPGGGKFEYNQGEQGLLARDVDYFIADSLTYSRLLENESVCRTIPVECDFFKKLIAGEVTSFRLLETFTYTLPPYLPQLEVRGVNPEIRIYERVR